MKLDIIITHYNEPYSIVKPAFDMLENQRMVDWNDFRVILVNDGEDCKIPEISQRSFPFPFVELTIPHKGVSAARNAGLDYSDAEWVMFCDCDDSLSNRYSLSEYITALDNPGFQIMWSPFYIEIGVDKTKRFTVKKFDQIRLVGKIFDRQFLVDHDLRFCEDLWCGEDMAFMSLLLTIIDGNKNYKVGEIEVSSPLYSVVPHGASVTHDLTKRFRNAVGVYRKQIYMHDEFLRRGYADLGERFIIRAMTDAYFTLCRTDLTDDKTEFDEEVWSFYQQHRDYINSMNDDFIVEMLKSTYNEFAGTLTEEQKPIPYKNWLPLWVKAHESKSQ